jgi:tetratricopeptide (TPR) repeat protein
MIAADPSVGVATALLLHALLANPEPPSVFLLGTPFSSPIQMHSAHESATASLVVPRQTPSFLTTAVSSWLVAASLEQPSNDDVGLLQSAFATLYGADRDVPAAIDLLSKTINRWNELQQPPDEKAGLYRVRGDAYMFDGNAAAAEEDYGTCLALLLDDSKGENKAEASEYPSAYLGRARAIKSQKEKLTPSRAALAAADYRQHLLLSSREDAEMYDSPTEQIADGAARNPYAAWEWGSCLRRAGRYREAYEAHTIAAGAFAETGDAPHMAISQVDAGIDLAADVAEMKADEQERSMAKVEKVLSTAVESTKGVAGRDVKLLQRVIAKEGEGRMALAALLWTDGDRSHRTDAERVLGDACLRLEQLQSQVTSMKQQPAAESGAFPLPFSIDDDDITPLDRTCNKYKNVAFLTEQLDWPKSLQGRVLKLENLQS